MFRRVHQASEGGTFTFGDAENDYPHSQPAEYIRLRDPDALELLLRQAETAGKASFNRAEFKRTDAPQQIKWMLIELQSAFGDAHNAFEHLKDARKAAGDLKGKRRPYKRPNDSSLNLQKIHTQNEHEHALGAGMLAYKLQIDLYWATEIKLRECSDALAAVLPHFTHEDVQLMCKHNIMCSAELLRQSDSFVQCMTTIDPHEYKILTSWISRQWDRFVQRTKKA